MKRRLLFVVVWLLGVAVLWWGLPPAPRHSFSPPPGWKTIGVTRDGLFVAAGPDRMAAWECGTGRVRWQTDGLRDPTRVSFDQITDRVLLSLDQTLDARTGQPADIPPDPPVASDDGRFVAGRQSDAHVWTVTDTQTGTVVFNWPVAPTDDQPAAVSRDGRRVLSERGVLWAADLGQRMSVSTSLGIGHAVLTADGRSLVTVLDDNRLLWIDTADGSERATRWKGRASDAVIGVWPARPTRHGDARANGLLVVTVWRHTDPPRWMRWLARQRLIVLRAAAPATVDVLVEDETGESVAELPPGWTFVRHLDDGRVAAEHSSGQYAVFDLPPRPDRWLLIGLTVGWTPLVVWATRRPRRSGTDAGRSISGGG